MCFSAFLERLLATLLKEKKGCSDFDPKKIAVTLSEEIEYSEDNTVALLFEIESKIAFSK